MVVRKNVRDTVGDLVVARQEIDVRVVVCKSVFADSRAVL